MFNRITDKQISGLTLKYKKTASLVMIASEKLNAPIPMATIKNVKITDLGFFDSL